MNSITKKPSTVPTAPSTKPPPAVATPFSADCARIGGRGHQVIAADREVLTQPARRQTDQRQRLELQRRPTQLQRQVAQPLDQRVDLADEHHAERGRRSNSTTGVSAVIRLAAAAGARRNVATATAALARAGRRASTPSDRPDERRQHPEQREAEDRDRDQRNRRAHGSRNSWRICRVPAFGRYCRCAPAAPFRSLATVHSPCTRAPSPSRWSASPNSSRRCGCGATASACWSSRVAGGDPGLATAWSPRRRRHRRPGAAADAGHDAGRPAPVRPRAGRRVRGAPRPATSCPRASTSRCATSRRAMRNSPRTAQFRSPVGRLASDQMVVHPGCTSASTTR